MEGTDVQPVRAGHHGLVSGATPRRRPLCLGVSEAAISVAGEAASRDRASAHVRSSDRGSCLHNCIAADSSAAVAPHGVAGTWRPASAGSSFPVQVGVDPVTGAEPGASSTRRNVRVETGRGDTVRLQARTDFEGFVHDRKGQPGLIASAVGARGRRQGREPHGRSEVKQTRGQCSGENRRDGEKP
jgi:hypothetical protein